MQSIDENVQQSRADKSADLYFKKYKPQMEILESSTLAKVRPITSFDYYAVGKMLESWDEYLSITEEDGTVSQLGKIPNVAYDVITLAYSASPIGAICSVQPIPEESGSIYYKKIIAQTTRGNVTAGDILFQPNEAADTEAMNYATERMYDEALATTVDETTTYTSTASALPVRPYTVKVEMGDLVAADDGSGKLLGYDIQGTINYTTGEVTVELTDNPGNGESITLTYSQDMEAAEDIPKIIMKFSSKPVRANIYALKDTVGLEQSYAMRRRFNMIAEDELSIDLVASLNAELMNRAVYLAKTGAIGNINWSKTPGTGVSYFEHKQQLKDILSDAESTMVGNAGRGTINVMIAGRDAAALMSTLPGFVKISDGTTIGPHIFGSLDGVTVIRIPAQATLPANEIICMYKGTSPFEAPLVHAPYMPLVISTALPTGQNPLVNQKAAATWCAIATLVPQFMTRVTITT